MPPPNIASFAARLKLLDSEFPYSLQDPKAWAILEVGNRLDKVPVDKRCDSIEDGVRRQIFHHKFSAFDRETADENRKASEEQLLVWRQKIVAPRDRLPHPLQPNRKIGW